jgi:hypothetical protein
MLMYEGFSGQARKAVQLAHDEARRLGQEYVGTEHLLLGLLREPSQGAGRLLSACGVDPARLAREAEAMAQRGPALVDGDKLPLTPRAVKALEYAREEAAGLKHPSIGPEHLVLGLLRETEGIAGQLLVAARLVVGQLREALANMPPPDNRDWMLRTEHVPSLSGAADPSPRDLDALVTDEVLPVAGRRRTSAGKTRRPPNRREPNDAETTDTRRRVRRDDPDFELTVVEWQLRALQFLVAAVLGAVAGGMRWGAAGAAVGLLAGVGVAAIRSHGLGALAGCVAGVLAAWEASAPALPFVGGLTGLALGACLGDWRQLPAPPGTGSWRRKEEPAEAPERSRPR